MAKQNSYSKIIATRLHIAFIIALFILAVSFYLFPRFKPYYSKITPSDDLTFDIIEIPVTIQDKIADFKPKQPEIPREIEKIEILDSVLIAIQDEIKQNNGTEIDSQVIAFISDTFPELLEIKEFDPEPIIEKSKKVYNFKNYFAYRMNLPDKSIPHEPSSPLVDEALGGPNKMIKIDLVQIPLSSTKVINIEKIRLTLADLMKVREYFHLLGYLYEKSALSLLELYNINNVYELYTYAGLSKAVETLCEKGLLKVSTQQNEKMYSVAFTVSEMIENINRILTEIPEWDQQNREYLYELVHMLVIWS